jgi:hypothetical protein
VVIIDGLDLFSSNYDSQSLQWLKWCHEFPREKVKVIVSVVEGGSVAKTFRSWNPEPKIVRLAALDVAERVIPLFLVYKYILILLILLGSHLYLDFRPRLFETHWLCIARNLMSPLLTVR